MRKPKVWTFKEIEQLPLFGAQMGWFFGFCRDDKGKLLFGEIFPGMGIAAQFPYPWWNPITWWRAARDVFVYGNQLDDLRRQHETRRSIDGTEEAGGEAE